MAEEQTLPAPSRQADLKIALQLTYLTLGWMTIEAVSALWLGIGSKSLLLGAFGFDSLVEMASACILLWRLRVEAGGGAGAARIEAVERQAARWVGYTLYGLALFVALSSAYGLFGVQRHTNTSESVWGIVVGLIAKVGMPLLAGFKLQVAARLNSRALRADAMEAVTCGYLSVVLMVGLAATLVLPSLWWLDSIAALALIPFLVKEGREAISGNCECGGNKDDT